MAMAAALLILLLVTPAAVFAVDYTVGDSSGWSQTVDYTTWVSGKTFKVGDVLVFIYGENHKVNMVNKNTYDNCRPGFGDPTVSFSGGNTSVKLTTLGAMYFICPTPGHCSSGMKLAVTVTGTSTTPSGTTTSPSGNGAASTLCNTNNLMFVTISVALGVVFAFMV